MKWELEGKCGSKSSMAFKYHFQNISGPWLFYYSLFIACFDHRVVISSSIIQTILTVGIRSLRLLIFLYESIWFYFVYFFFSAFTTTGFDCHTSPVFSPANPESSIEDCLAHLGEKVSQELKEHLHKALQSLLSKWVFICLLKGKMFSSSFWLLLKF